MKALTHVTMALAAATFVPGVLALPSAERSEVLLLAAAFGVLPDALDVLVARFELSDAAPNSNQQLWSHSLVVASGFSLAAGGLLGELAGWVVALALLTHLALDALGPRGIGWAWPLMRERSAGLGCLLPDDVGLNMLVTWLGAGLVLYNLSTLTPQTLTLGPSLLFWGVLVPAFVGGVRYSARRPAAKPARAQVDSDAP